MSETSRSKAVVDCSAKLRASSGLPKSVISWPGALQNLSQKAANRWVVVDEKHSLRLAPAVGRGHGGWRDRQCLGRELRRQLVRTVAAGTRQQHLHDGAAPAFGLDPDLSAALVGEPLDHGQTQASTRFVRLGGEERVEDPLQIAMGDAPAVVRDLHQDAVTLERAGEQALDVRGLEVERADGDRAPGSQCILGVEHQMDEGLVERLRVDRDPPEVGLDQQA